MPIHELVVVKLIGGFSNSVRSIRLNQVGLFYFWGGFYCSNLTMNGYIDAGCNMKMQRPVTQLDLNLLIFGFIYPWTRQKSNFYSNRLLLTPG
jgi:hypothetical protein